MKKFASSAMITNHDVSGIEMFSICLFQGLKCEKEQKFIFSYNYGISIMSCCTYAPGHVGGLGNKIK